MLINQSNLGTLFKAFNSAFTKGFDKAPSFYKQVALTVPSSTGEENYGWLGLFPKMREWIGPRVVKNLSAYGYTLKNRTFENTIGVPRPTIEDDRYGVFSPIFEAMGQSAAEHPDELIFTLLKAGFSTTCYDGQFFFDVDHPVTDENGNTVIVSNMQAGALAPWFLLDTSRAIKPLIFQERIPYTLTALDQDSDDPVFKNDEYIYGVRSRVNAGFGLWQLAYASKADLTPDNYELAREAMRGMKGDEGRPLNLNPDVLVVPPSLEGEAMRLLNNGTRIVISGATPVAIQNEWAGTAKPIITPWVA